MSVILRPALPSDAAFILALEENGMRGYAEALWGKWRASATPETLDLTGHEMILRAARPVGCLASDVAQGDLVIRKLYVAQTDRRCGVGADALRQKIEVWPGRVRLRTLATNTDAMRFYVREGFAERARDAEHVYFERSPQFRPPVAIP